MSGERDPLTQRLLDRADRGRFTTAHEPSPLTRRLLERTGRAPVEPASPPAGEMRDDELTRVALRWGCRDVALLRRYRRDLEELEGAALEAAVRKTLAEQPLLAPDYPERASAAQLDGGARGALPPKPPSVSERLYAAVDAGRGLPLVDDGTLRGRVMEDV
jgi:hypothetical protein